MLGAGLFSFDLYILLSTGLLDLSVAAIKGGAREANDSLVVTWCLSVLLSVSPLLLGPCDPEAILLPCVEGCGDCDPLPSILSALLPTPSTFPSRDLTFGIFSPVAAVRRSECPEALECDIIL